MDIRIGNDIRIDATITDYIESDQYCIKRINCLLINTDNTDDQCLKAFPQFCTPTDYTTHSCGNVTYNTMPVSRDVCNCGYTQPLLTGNSPKNLTFKIGDQYLDELKNHYWYEPHILFNGKLSLLLVYFPGKHHHVCGTYKLVVFIVLYDQSWTDPHTHTVVIKCEELFKLVHEDSEFERTIVNILFTLNDTTIYTAKADDGKDGESSIQVQVFTDYGNILIDDDLKVTLIAQVWNGLEDITDSISSYDLSWIRISKDTESDKIWNIAHAHVGKTTEVSLSELNKKALYQCIFDFESYFNN